VRILYSLLLVGVTVVWGWTFVVVQDAITLYGVLGFLVVRFVLAAVALAPYGAHRISLQTLMVGAGIGIALVLGYLFQTTGLLLTSPTNSGLITRLFVVFAPLADRLIFGVRFSW
jgi:drug/metabolite transporter (DMT)-like permease